MTPLRQPLPVHGHTHGLLCRGMPMRWPKWVVASGDPRDTYAVIDPSDPAHRSSTVDWSSTLALYAALHWLTSRGHRCLWMLPESHEGRVRDHRLAPGTCPTCADGVAYAGGMETCPDCHGTGARTLSAWEVSAILMSVSVARVAEGGKPVSDLYRDEDASGDLVWSVKGWLRLGMTPELRRAALADGAALLVEGGVVVRVPGAS